MALYLEAVERISPQARSIWAKSDYGVGEGWLPLYIHMSDSAGVAERLWDVWLPEATRKTIAMAFGGDECLARKVSVWLAGVHDIGKATPVFQAKDAILAQKVNPVGSGSQLTSAGQTKARHPIAGDVILTGYLKEHGFQEQRHAHTASALADVIGAHHGNFPSRDELLFANGIALGLKGKGSDSWRQLQAELIEYSLALASINADDLRCISTHRLTVATETLLTGLVIMSDWLASDQDLFPLISLHHNSSELSEDFIKKRIEDAWSSSTVFPAWSEEQPAVKPFQDYFTRRFSLPTGAQPRPIQTEASRVAYTANDPGLIVIEAPMGEGKTEAALAAAELLAWRLGMGGVCVALPTMATTDAMFSRVESWLAKLPHTEGMPEKSIYLAHGKARLNEQFQGIVSHSNKPHPDDDADSVVVSEWMLGRKRGMLSNFVVCTVDQVLMGALCMRHISLRQLALANKVIVIDECHAYDLYMRQYLCRLLQWLGYWHVPVILLSATLPERQRDEMVTNYLSGRRLIDVSAAPSLDGSSRRPDSEENVAVDAYPLITYTDASEVKRLETAPSGRKISVSIVAIDDGIENLVELLSSVLSEGGCAGVICDTVGRAQEVATALAEHFGDDLVLLDHARFMDIDRMENEVELRRLLGPKATRENGIRPNFSIVVGTQVLEQSLDIDFDVLVTDVAPIDLLMQRLGRMHRHKRGEEECDRPSPLRSATCYVRGIDSWEEDGPHFPYGLKNVYDSATLMESLSVLGLNSADARVQVSLPNDISHLVRTAYSNAEKEDKSQIPSSWQQQYEDACATRKKKRQEKISRAQSYLLHDLPNAVKNDWTLQGLADSLFAREDAQDADSGERAVRDTQESIEVLLVRKQADGISLLPWVGGKNVSAGSALSTDTEPNTSESIVLAECAVRLPAIASSDGIEKCISALKEAGRPYTTCWQRSPWLSRRLLLPMEEVSAGIFEVTLLSHRFRYTRHDGLSVLHT